MSIRRVEDGRRQVALRRALACFLIAGWPAAGVSSPTQAPADDPFFVHGAGCVAALEFDQLALVARARAGAPGLRDEIIRTTVLGFTFVGVAYKRGLREPRADALLNAARSEQREWPPEQHAQTVAACRIEGQRLFDEASGLEQWLVTNRATARVDRYLNAPARPAPSTPASSARP
jgi:hypothetical protein